MGLSASQARLLSITARISDNELHSQQIANAKVRLADQSQEASREYVNALDTQKLMYTMYDAKGNATKVNLTPAVMYDYAEMKNQYGISNNAGQLLVKKADAENFMNSNTFQEFYRNYLTSSVPVNQAWTEQTNIRNELAPFYEQQEQMLAREPKLEYATLGVGARTIPRTNHDQFVIYSQEPWEGEIPPKPPVEFVDSLREEPIIPEEVSEPDPDDYFGIEIVTTYQKTTNRIKELANEMQPINAGSTSATGNAYNKAIAAAKGVEQILSPIIYLMIENNEFRYFDNEAKEYDTNGYKLEGYDVSYSGPKLLQLTFDLDKNNVNENNTSLTSGVAVTDNDRRIYNSLSTSEEQALFHIYTNALALICLFPNGNQNPTKTWGDLYYPSNEGAYTGNVNYVERKTLFRSGAIENIWLNLSNEGSQVLMDSNMVKALVFDGNNFKFQTLLQQNESIINKFNKTTTATQTQRFDYPEYYQAHLDAYNNYINAMEDHDAWLEEKAAYEFCQEYCHGNEQEFNSAKDAYEKYQQYKNLGDDIDEHNSITTMLWNVAHDAWQEEYEPIRFEILKLEDQTDITIQEYSADNNPHYQWYYNLWCRMNGGEGTIDKYHNIYKISSVSVDENSSKYWKVLEDNLFNSSSWLQYALEQGLVTLEQVQFVNPAETDTGLETAKWQSKVFTTCTDIQFVDDETAVARAEAIYTKKLNEIEAKDKKYDSDIKKLDTEHNALQTEYESVKSVIDKNVERSFKAFS